MQNSEYFSLSDLFSVAGNQELSAGCWFNFQYWEQCILAQRGGWYYIYCMLQTVLSALEQGEKPFNCPMDKPDFNPDLVAHNLAELPPDWL